MKKWESQYIELPTDFDKMFEKINEEGQKGWEFCTTFWTVIHTERPNPLSPFPPGNRLVGIFKREIPEQPAGCNSTEFHSENDPPNSIVSTAELDARRKTVWNLLYDEAIEPGERLDLVFNLAEQLFDPLPAEPPKPLGEHPPELMSDQPAEPEIAPRCRYCGKQSLRSFARPDGKLMFQCERCKQTYEAPPPPVNVCAGCPHAFDGCGRNISPSTETLRCLPRPQEGDLGEDGCVVRHDK